MNWRRILLMNLCNRCQRFDSDARRLTLKDTDHYHFKNKICVNQGSIYLVVDPNYLQFLNFPLLTYD